MFWTGPCLKIYFFMFLCLNCSFSITNVFPAILFSVTFYQAKQRVQEQNKTKRVQEQREEAGKEGPQQSGELANVLLGFGLHYTVLKIPQTFDTASGP